MEEYLKTLLEQIRCKKAHASIYHEIRGHIEEQVADNIAEDMSKDDALKAALNDMGDPVQTGVEMDQLHRPQMAWRIIVAIGILTLFSILIQYLVTRYIPDNNAYFFRHHIFNAIISFSAMIVVYRIDYSLIGKYSKWIATIFLLFFAFQIFIVEMRLNGTLYMRILSKVLIMSPLFFLYVPLFGAILYQYRGKGWRVVPKIFIWMALPLFLTLELPNLGVTISLFFMLASLLTIAVWKGWFTFHKKKFLTAFWGISISFPIASVAILMQTGKLAPYQIARIHALFDPTVENHALQTLRSIVTNSAFIGASNKKSLLQEGQNSDYILSTLSAYYGILVALVAVLLILLLIRKIFQISSSQKNQLGMMMGYGCGIVFFVSAFWNVLVTLGLVFPTYTFLPFFSYGGVTMVVTYILLGIVLSIYRYKNVLSDTYMYKKIGMSPKRYPNFFLFHISDKRVTTSSYHRINFFCCTCSDCSVCRINISDC